MLHPSTLVRLAIFVGLGLFIRAVLNESHQRRDHPQLPPPEPEAKRPGRRSPSKTA